MALTSGGQSQSSSSSNCRKTKRSRDSTFQRTSVFRGVTRHRWTGRFEAHLWDKDCWNLSQNKKGKQVYLGAYDDEAAAARAYDLAAIKYWGNYATLNFTISTYQQDLRQLEQYESREEYISYLRRKSSGFSRGVSKFRGVARHHQNGRWEARLGRVFGNKYLYLGTYATEEEAAIAYDLAAIEHRGLNAVTNFDVNQYINKWLPPDEEERLQQKMDKSSTAGETVISSATTGSVLQAQEIASSSRTSTNGAEKTAQCSFPDYTRTDFECQDCGSFSEKEDSIFGDLEAFLSPINECELDAFIF